MPEVRKENEDGVRPVQKGDDVSKENESKQILRLAALCPEEKIAKRNFAIFQLIKALTYLLLTG